MGGVLIPLLLLQLLLLQLLLLQLLLLQLLLLQLRVLFKLAATVPPSTPFGALYCALYVQRRPLGRKAAISAMNGSDHNGFQTQ